MVILYLTLFYAVISHDTKKRVTFLTANVIGFGRGISPTLASRDDVGVIGDDLGLCPGEVPVEEERRRLGEILALKLELVKGMVS